MTCKKCWISVAVLLAVIAGMTYKFIFSGSVETSSDGRSAVLLEADERDFILSEMRMFLESVQAINVGVSKNDLKMVIEASRKVGSAAQQTVPATLSAKLPLAFKTLGFDTHSKFDQLALNVQDFGDREHALKMLGELMNNCVACHSTYRLELAGKT